MNEIMTEKQEEIQKISRAMLEQQKEIQKISKTVLEQQKEFSNLIKENEKLSKKVESAKKGITVACEKILSEMARIKIPYTRIINQKIKGIDTIKKLLQDYEFETVLDIGCGEGIHAEEFLHAGKKVTAIDYGKSDYFFKKGNHINAIVADFNTYEFTEKFDCIWCSHVLEHQLNVNLFLKKIYSLLNDDGILAIVVPPAKQQIVGGHVSLWNQGILLYNLILAGFDCSKSYVCQYDYNVSVIVRKK